MTTAYVYMPGSLPLTTLYLLLAVAAVISGVRLVRLTRQAGGRRWGQGAGYGFAFLLGLAGLAAVLSEVSWEIPQAYTWLLWGGCTVALVSTAHTAGGALWPDRRLFRFGLWMNVANLAGLEAGIGWHSLIVCLASAAAMLLVGVVAITRRIGRSARHRVGRQALPSARLSSSDSIP